MKRNIKFGSCSCFMYQANRGSKRGGFGVLKKQKWTDCWFVDYFYTCREVFELYFSSPDIVFQCKDGSKVMRLVLAVEKRLGLKKHTNFGATQYPDCFWFKAAPFWLRNPIRRSFFTALLRAGCTYDDSISLKNLTNIKNALYSMKYFDCTKKAVEMFLRGYTIFTKDSIAFRSGWYKIFQHKEDAKDIRKLLVKDVKK